MYYNHAANVTKKTVQHKGPNGKTHEKKITIPDAKVQKKTHSQKCASWNITKER